MNLGANLRELEFIHCELSAEVFLLALKQCTRLETLGLSGKFGMICAVKTYRIIRYYHSNVHRYERPVKGIGGARALVPPGFVRKSNRRGAQALLATRTKALSEDPAVV